MLQCVVTVEDPGEYQFPEYQMPQTVTHSLTNQEKCCMDLVRLRPGRCVHSSDFRHGGAGDPMERVREQ